MPHPLARFAQVGVRPQVIGLSNLPDGCHHLVTPIGRLFVRVRQRRVVWVELSPIDGSEVRLWPATTQTALAITYAKTGELLSKGVTAADQGA